MLSRRVANFCMEDEVALANMKNSIFLAGAIIAMGKVPAPYQKVTGAEAKM